jgi:hypothetical protein
MVADMGHGAAKMLVEGINQRHGILIQPAERRDKFDHIELINSDFHVGRIKILKDSDLALELSMLQWDLSQGGKELLAKQGKLKEHYDLENHLSDAFLYAWRFANHFWGEARVKAPPKHSYEAIEASENAWMNRYVTERDSDGDPFDDDRFERTPRRDPLRSFYRR